MTIKPSRLRAFFKTFLFSALIITLHFGALPYLLGKNVILGDLIPMVIAGSTFLGLGVTVMFTPHEIVWTKEKFIIRAFFFGSGEFSWKHLEGYSSFGKYFGTFLIKFKGQQAFQMVPFGFHPAEWREFQLMLRNRFPEKKTWVWFGPNPIHFWKK